MKPRRIGQRTEDDALRVSHAEHRRLHAFTSHRQLDLPQILRRSHRRPEGVALPFAPHQLQLLGARTRFDHNGRAHGERLGSGDQRGQTAQPIARQLRRSSRRR